MPYIENPKTLGSGIHCAIPQKGLCVNRCQDCFFQNGRSYLEPLAEKLPNMPDPEVANAMGWIIRVNDGNDSLVDQDLVIEATKDYKQKYYNSAIPREVKNYREGKPFAPALTTEELERFTKQKYPGPVVVTINPAEMTDVTFYKMDPIPRNLMFVRFRANTWNSELMDDAVAYYTSKNVPVVLTFMAYWKYEGSIPNGHNAMNYTMRKRTLNTYLAITTEAWRHVMKRYEDNPLVHSCGKIKGEKGKTGCKFCGNDLREYFSTMERMNTRT